MKQFISCLIACVIFYIACVFMAADLNISNWNPEGRSYFGLFIIFIWFVPIFWNVINGNPNFVKKSSIINPMKSRFWDL